MSSLNLPQCTSAQRMHFESIHSTQLRLSGDAEFARGYAEGYTAEYVRGVAAERSRWSAVFQHPAAETRPRLARHLLLHSESSPQQVVSALEAAGPETGAAGDPRFNLRNSSPLASAMGTLQVLPAAAPARSSAQTAAAVLSLWRQATQGGPDKPTAA